MTRKLFPALVLLLILGSLRADEKQPVKEVRKTSFDVSETGSADGIVLAVTKDSILITMEKAVPKTFPLHDLLAAGKVHKLVRACNSYGIADVKVGDMVELDTILENKQTYCVAICIYERPGGLIPAGQVVALKKTYHEVANARIAFRDKGTPIPEHLKPMFPSVPPVVPKK